MPLLSVEYHYSWPVLGATSKDNSYLFVIIDYYFDNPGASRRRVVENYYNQRRRSPLTVKEMTLSERNHYHFFSWHGDCCHNTADQPKFHGGVFTRSKKIRTHCIE
jgi:hypothetical protein